MTNQRNPTEDRFKQVFYENNRIAPYTSGKIGLDDYLQTDVWLKLRNKRLKMDFHRCVYCGTGINVEVHHSKYPEVWGEENVERDLITVCPFHHREIHINDINNNKYESSGMVQPRKDRL